MKLMEDDESLGRVTAEATSSSNLRALLCMTGRVTIVDGSIYV